MRLNKFLLVILVCLVSQPVIAKSALKTETRFFLRESGERQVTLTERGVVLEAQVWPERLLVLKQDAVSIETGKVVLKAGTQLVPQTILEGGTNFCTTRPARGNLLTGENMLCFTDKDGDLSFDEYVWTISALRSGVATGYYVPANANKIRPVDAEEVPVDQLDRRLVMRLEWAGGDGLRKPMQFEGVFCVDGMCDWKTKRFEASRSDEMNRTEFLSYPVSCVITGSKAAACEIGKNMREDYLGIDVRGIRTVEGRVF